MHRRFRESVMVVTLALIFLPSGAHAKSGPRPFLAIVSGNANPMPTSDPCVLTNDEKASGWATGMGTVIWLSREVADFCANPNGAVVNGEGVVKASNGDELFLVYETLATTDPEFTELSASGRYEITGGTGRFTGAAGTGFIAAQGSLLPPFEFVGVLIGKIILVDRDP